MMIDLTRKFAAAVLSALLAVVTWPALPVLAADATQESPAVESLEVVADKVIIHTDGAVVYKSFVTAKPPRLILQFDGAEYHAAAKRFEGKGKFLKAVRAGQFQREPSLIARVVIDLNEMAAYRIVKNEDGLSVDLGDAPAATTASSDQVQPAAAVQAETAVVAIKPKEASAAAPTPAPVAAAAPVKKNEIARDAPSDTQAPAAAPAKEVGGVDSQYSSELSSDAGKGSVADEGSPEAPKKQASSAAAVASVKGQRSGDIIQRLPHDLVSLDFDNTDIRDVLRLLGAKARVNLIYGQDVSGNLTLHLVDVPFVDAFRTALSMMNLVTIQVGDNILRIVPPSSARSTSAVGLTSKVIPLNYQKASDVVAALNTVRTAEGRSGTAIADVKTNSLIVTDSVEGMLANERLISQLDQRPKQVLIEAKLIEVNLNNSLSYGIQWDYASFDRGSVAGKQGLSTIGGPLGPSIPNTIAFPADQNAATTGFGNGSLPGALNRGTGVNLPADKVFGALTLGRVTNDYFLNATLTAAAAQGKVKVLSDPKVATLNNQPANINVTTQFPYVTSNVTATGVTSSAVTYVTTGIQLTVTPTINADGRITLIVNPNVSQPSATAATNTQTGAPGIDARTALTTVLVKDGETIVVGGLISDSVSDVISKVPLLGDIPILGWLFKKKTVQRARTELLIFVTTKIMD